MGVFGPLYEVMIGNVRVTGKRYPEMECKVYSTNLIDSELVNSAICHSIFRILYSQEDGKALDSFQFMTGSLRKRYSGFNEDDEHDAIKIIPF